jgi:pheromone shutdown protein TraB
MKVSKEFFNGAAIFVGIGIYFLLMNALGLADKFYLRLFNIFFVYYGVNRTLQMNLAEGKSTFVLNAVSAMTTSLVGVILSIAGLIIYSYMRGGDGYVETLSETFLFGGNPSVMTYSICLFFEGVASSVVVTLFAMLYWNNKFAVD